MGDLRGRRRRLPPRHPRTCLRAEPAGRGVGLQPRRAGRAGAPGGRRRAVPPGVRRGAAGALGRGRGPGRRGRHQRARAPHHPRGRRAPRAAHVLLAQGRRRRRRQRRSRAPQPLARRPQPHAGGRRPYGLTTEGAGFAAGVLDHLPGLLALGAPSVASYLRLVPQHWAGAYPAGGWRTARPRCGSSRVRPGRRPSANLEVKCVDLHANPYLLWPDCSPRAPPASTPARACPSPSRSTRVARRGGSGRSAHRTPSRGPARQRRCLRRRHVLAEALGPALVAGVRAVRESEIERFDGASPELVAAPRAGPTDTHLYGPAGPGRRNRRPQGKNCAKSSSFRIMNGIQSVS